jgi:hypothetical protein
MFNFFKKNKSLANNSKKVKKWHKEHEMLGECAVNIVKAYEKKDLNLTRKHLVKLQDMAFSHLMDEDLTFFELLEQAEASDLQENQEIIDAMKEFRRSFLDVKSALIHFLIKYTNPENELDEEFKKTLDAIIEALVNRIEFEENNLYLLINN